MIRKSKALKYSKAVLPETIGSFEGYHVDCYRRFRALGKGYMQSDSPSSPANYTTRSQQSTALISTSSTAIVPNICIFYEKKDKKHNNKKQPSVRVETDRFEQKIKIYAAMLEDTKMLATFGYIDFVAKEIMYHVICRTKYQAKAEQGNKNKTMETKKISDWHRSRSLHCEAFQSIYHLVEDEVIEEKEVYLMSELNDQYIAILNEHMTECDSPSTSRMQALETKLKQHFKDKITIQKGRTRRGNLLFSYHTTKEEALRKEHLMKTKLTSKIRDVAFALRAAISDADHKPLSTNITLDKVMLGEVEVPQEVLQFFTYLIIGPGRRASESTSKLRRVKSISEDVVYATTSGRKKPSKQLKLGLAMKSGSKKVIEMLNHYGHCASYTTVEELETELTFSSCSEKKITPPEMSCIIALDWPLIILIASLKHQVVKIHFTTLYVLHISVWLKMKKRLIKKTTRYQLIQSRADHQKEGEHLRQVVWISSLTTKTKNYQPCYGAFRRREKKVRSIVVFMQSLKICWG